MHERNFILYTQVNYFLDFATVKPIFVNYKISEEDARLLVLRVPKAGPGKMYGYN